MKAAMFALVLSACGGAIDHIEDAAPGDASLVDERQPDVVNDASTEAASDAAPVCVTDGISYVCAPGSSWTWGTAAAVASDAGTPCWVTTCVIGSVCELTKGGDPGTCAK